MKTLNQQFQSDLSEVFSNLTAEEKEVLKKSTLQDWIHAIIELVKSPEFWVGIGVAFAEGVIQGVDDYVDDQF
jgi:hypothetical protein